jgi:uncharacterized protein (TIGR01619 family)
MPDDWKFFMCQMGDHLASIMVDVGIADSIESAPPRLARMRLKYKQPSENGLPTNEEFEAVVALEDTLEEFLAGTGDVYAGRVTTKGHRQFLVYTTRDEQTWKAFAGDLSARSGYVVQGLVEDDAAHDGYWKDLYPTPDDWCVIRDMEVVEQLEKAGDDSSVERKIEHWIYFPSEAAAGPFIAWATADRFTHDAEYSGADDDGRYGVRLHHVGPSDQRAISSHTIALSRKAQEFGGDYDGWETSVEKPALRS